MRLRLKKISDQVMVITGASSGIALTTARMAARRGARLVLAARNEEALRALTDEIVSAGGEATYAVADVGREDEVAAIARTAIARFGGFDTWVNDAGVGIYGGLMDVLTTDSRRLFDTNFWGVVFGSLEAARHFRHRRDKHAGAIINLGSEVSDRAVPVLGMYSASKHAVKGFTDALRMELEKAGDSVSVSLVKPSAIDTPFPIHARNYMAEEPELPAPIYAPEVVAEVILHCAQTPVRDIFAGASAKKHSAQAAFMPRLLDWMMEALFFEKQKSSRPARHDLEALDYPTEGLLERSGTRHDAKETSAYSRASRHPVLSGAVAVGAVLGMVALAAMVVSNRRA